MNESRGEIVGQTEYGPQSEIVAELEAAFLFEQELVAKGASDAEIFLARQDRMAKEQLATGNFSPVDTLITAVLDNTVIQTVDTPVTDSPPTVKPDLNSTPVKATEIFEIQVFHEPENQESLPVKYRAAAEAANRLSGIVSREDHDTHGIPTVLHPEELLIGSDDYEKVIREALMGFRDIGNIPKPSSAHMRAKARQALANIASETDNKLKTQEWTKLYFELQGKLMSYRLPEF